MKKSTKNNGRQELAVSFADDSEASWAPPINLQRGSLPVLDALKRRLLQGHLEQADESLHPWLQRAADDAVSLAWTLPFPWLFLPDLLAEKAGQATQRVNFQQSVLDRGPSWTRLAA